MKIVFMGTPDFAVPCLQALLDHPYEVAGVFTQPDKPKGRGYQLTPPPVKELAVSRGIPVFQPRTLRDGEALAQLQVLRPDLIIVVAYGKIASALFRRLRSGLALRLVTGLALRLAAGLALRLAAGLALCTNRRLRNIVPGDGDVL